MESIASSIKPASGLWIGGEWVPTPQQVAIVNPANPDDTVGRVADASSEEVEAALARSESAAASWAATPATERAAMLEGAADALEAAMPALLGYKRESAARSSIFGTSASG